MVFSILVVLTGLSANAESLLKNRTGLTTRQKEKSDAKFYGMMDIRPQIGTSDGALSAENCFEAGMAWDWGSVGYFQEIDTSFAGGDTSAVNPSLGFLRVKRNAIWESNNTKLNLDFWGLLPTAPAKQERGMITAVRSHFNVVHQLSRNVKFQFSEVPIIHVYQDSGVVLADGSVANPIFENRFMFIPTFTLAEGITFSVPMIYAVTRYCDFHFSAKLNDDWDPSFILWPEFSFKVNDTVSVGAAYRTDNFLKVNEEGTYTADGFGNGVVQGVLGLSF